MLKNLLINNKSQVQQIFIFIFAVLVIGVIALIGIRSFSTIDDTRCEAKRAEFNSFINGLSEENKKFGLIRTLEVGAPCDFELLCFADVRHSAVDVDFGSSSYGDNLKEIIKSIVSDADLEQNVFLVNRDIVEPVSIIRNLFLSNDFQGPPTDLVFCVDGANGKFEFLVEGKGDGVILDKKN